MAGALATQLEGAIPGLVPEPLTLENLGLVDHLPGVYQLYWLGDLVYIGKADESLRERLTNHFWKISGRLNINISDLSFTGLYLEGTWIPVAPEQLLIRRYGEEPAWNKSGFGSKDPGKERDTTRVDGNHFDATFPANLDWPLAGIAGDYTVRELLPLLKTQLPYYFRYEDRYARHPDYADTHVHVPTRSNTADLIFRLIIDSLPLGWQITALPGYVIMYKNNKNYQSSRMVYRR